MVKIEDKEIDRVINESSQLKKVSEEYLRKKLNLNIAKIEKLNKDLNREIAKMKRQMADDGSLPSSDPNMGRVLEFMQMYRETKQQKEKSLSGKVSTLPFIENQSLNGDGPEVGEHYSQFVSRKISMPEFRNATRERMDENDPYLMEDYYSAADVTYGLKQMLNKRNSVNLLNKNMIQSKVA